MEITKRMMAVAPRPDWDLVKMMDRRLVVAIDE